jgi:hypothetical protein
MIFPWDCPPKKIPSVSLKERGFGYPSAKSAGGFLKLFSFKSSEASPQTDELRKNNSPVLEAKRCWILDA